MKRKLTISLFILILSANVFSQIEDPMPVVEEFLRLIQKNQFKKAEKVIYPLFQSEDDYNSAKEKIEFIADNKLKRKYTLTQALSDKTGYFYLIFQGIKGNEFDCRILLINDEDKWRIIDISLEKRSTKYILTNPPSPSDSPGFLNDPSPKLKCSKCG
jgi:hypothetical protein